VKRSFVVSSVVHAAFLVVVISPGFQRARTQMIEVVNVKLVGEERKQQPKPEVKQVKPPEPEPQPEKKPEEAKMAYKTPTKTRETKQEVKPARAFPAGQGGAQGRSAADVRRVDFERACG
jgi:outer membrane biosynthesis protein TonB